MAYAIADARWPLVTARATEFVDDPAALDPSYRKLEQILARKELFVLLFDMRGATSTSARRRRLFAWCDQHSDALTNLILAGAIVAASSLERGFVTAGLWVRSPAWPMRVFSDSPEAEAWLFEQFAQLVRARDR
jgi:hypothetical protein